MLVYRCPGAGGLALAEQVVAVLADGGSLAAGLREPVAGLVAGFVTRLTAFLTGASPNP